MDEEDEEDEVDDVEEDDSEQEDSNVIGIYSSLERSEMVQKSCTKTTVTTGFRNVTDFSVTFSWQISS